LYSIKKTISDEVRMPASATIWLAASVIAVKYDALFVSRYA
jgi:hypothetical protein